MKEGELFLSSKWGVSSSVVNELTVQHASLTKRDIVYKTVLILETNSQPFKWNPLHMLFMCLINLLHLRGCFPIIR